MSWIKVLADTYDNNAHMISKTQEGKIALAPIFHMTANAQIEITVSEDGQFLRAVTVPKENRATIIPVTEESAGRSNAPAAHALSDTFSYIAKDFSEYSGVKRDADKYKSYLKVIKGWATSEYTHPKVNAVYKYILSGTVMKDLINNGIISCDDKGKLADKKIEGNSYEKCLVRWRIQSLGDENEASWQDSTLFDSYIRYKLADESREKQLCYVTGEQNMPTYNHPKGIISSSYGAKLISAQTNSDFVYKGRFLDSREALTVGAITTQKAHNALRWLTANQSVNNFGDRTFLCWNPKGKSVPFPSGSDFLGETDDDEPDIPLTAPEYKKKLYMSLQGYRNMLEDNDDIIIMSMQAATTGRLSVTYYNELKASDFLDRIRLWYETCCWYFIRFTNEKKPYFAVETPSVMHTVKSAFGNETAGFLDVDKRILSEHGQRLIHCIIDSQPIPNDIVRAVTVRASTPEAYNRGNRERVLSVACALIRKYQNDLTGREDIIMELDAENTDRSYLFGRLLAVFEKAERATYSRDESREPNAIRLQTVFRDRPMHTFAVLHEAVKPYLMQLKPGSREYYRRLIEDIVAKIQDGDTAKFNQPLDDIYLIGYYLQRRELNKYNDKNKQEDFE